MQHNQAIEFRKQRDFGDVINVTFAFLRENLIPLGKSLLYIVGPAALLTGLVSLGFIERFNFSASDPEALTTTDWSSFVLLYFLLMLGALLTWVFAVSVVFGYIELYQERAYGDIEVSEVWQFVVKNFWIVLRTFIALSVMVVIGYFVLLIPMVIIFAAGSSTGSAIIGGLFFFFGFFGFLGALLYFSINYSLIFPVQLYESPEFFPAMKRSRFLVQHYWWQTFLVFFISFILMSILGILFSIPSYMITGLGGLHMIVDFDTSWLRYPLLIGVVIGTLGTSILYAIPLVASAIQYFSLVEHKEHAGLMGRIDGLTDTGDVPGGETQSEGL